MMGTLRQLREAAVRYNTCRNYVRILACIGFVAGFSCRRIFTVVGLGPLGDGGGLAAEWLCLLLLMLGYTGEGTGRPENSCLQSAACCNITCSFPNEQGRNYLPEQARASALESYCRRQNMLEITYSSRYSYSYYGTTGCLCHPYQQYGTYR